MGSALPLAPLEQFGVLLRTVWHVIVPGVGARVGFGVGAVVGAGVMGAYYVLLRTGRTRTVGPARSPTS